MPSSTRRHRQPGIGVAAGERYVNRDTSKVDDDYGDQTRELDMLAWVGRIRDAIDEDRIVFYAQPIVSLAAGPQSYELVCRMIDRDGESIPPIRSLPAAESYGLITELDLLAIDEGVRQIARGHRVNIMADEAAGLSAGAGADGSGRGPHLA